MGKGVSSGQKSAERGGHTPPADSLPLNVLHPRELYTHHICTHGRCRPLDDGARPNGRPREQSQLNIDDCKPVLDPHHALAMFISDSL